VLLNILLTVVVASVLFAGGTNEESSFIIGNGAEPESLDPQLISGVPEHRIYMGLFEGLVIPDPKTALPLPGVAKEWTISEDGTMFTFSLRKTTWSDGTPITAYDFVKSWLRILNPKTAAAYAWFPAMFIKGAESYNSGKAGPEVVQVRALDDYTFQFETVGPIPYAVKALTHYAFAVVPMHAIEKFGKEWTQPENFVGNGPYLLKEWKPQERIVLEKNPGYWNASQIKTKRVIFLPVESSTTMYSMYQNGEMDWATTVPLEQLETAQLRSDYQSFPLLATYYYVFQTQKAPFDDARVRKALSLAFNRDELTREITKGGQVPAYGIVPPISEYSQITGLGKEDITRAKKLLADAGYPNGKNFPKVQLLYNTSEAHKAIAEYIQQQWKENLNVDIELVNQEWKTYLSTRRKGEFQIARAGWVGDYNDPNTFLDMFVTGSALNGGRYASQQYDVLIKRSTQLRGNKRMKTLAEAERVLIEKDHAIMPIYHYVAIHMIDFKKWGGWYENVMDTHPVGNISTH